MSGNVVLLNIAGGVALLLWATRMIRTGILRAYGADLRHILGRSTSNRFKACGGGMGLTMLVQSSAATALLAMSFAGRGLISTAGGLSIMLGANIGSTAVVQVLSFDLSWLSPALILVGVAVFLCSSSPLWQHLSRVAVGLGLMILALSLIVSSSDMMRHSDVLATVMAHLSRDHILVLLLTLLLTWVCHSSVAVVLLVMSFVSTGVVPPELGVVMVIGANLGSGVVPLVLGLSESPRARRIPLGNLMFRIAAAAIVLPLVGMITPWLSLLESDPARQIANFHTFFNLAMGLAALPFVGIVARMTERVFPGDADKEDHERPRYLNPRVVDKPQEAIACAVRESLRMADTVEMMLRGMIDVFPHNDEKLLARVSKLDDKVDTLHEAIKLYVTRINRHCERETDRIRCSQIIDFTTNMEHVGDIIDKNLLEVAQQKIDDKASFSEAGWQELVKMHGLLMKQMQLAMSVFISGEKDLARKLLAGKRQVREMERRGNMTHFARLQSEQIESMETSGLHLDILRDFKRIDSHLATIAYAVLDANRRQETLLLEIVDTGETDGQGLEAKESGS